MATSVLSDFSEYLGRQFEVNHLTAVQTRRRFSCHTMRCQVFLGFTRTHQEQTRIFNRQRTACTSIIRQKSADRSRRHRAPNLRQSTKPRTHREKVEIDMSKVRRQGLEPRNAFSGIIQTTRQSPQRSARSTSAKQTKPGQPAWPHPAGRPGASSK